MLQQNYEHDEKDIAEERAEYERKAQPRAMTAYKPMKNTDNETTQSTDGAGNGRMQRLVSSDSENYPQEFRWNTEEHHNDNTETMSAFLDYMMPDNWKEMESQRDGAYAEAMVNGSELLLRLDASGDGDAYNHLVVASIIF